MSRHLQLARRLSGAEANGNEPDSEVLPHTPDPSLDELEIWHADAAASPEESVEIPSYEFAVRVLCPFCGSSDSSPTSPCCGQGLEAAPPVEPHEPVAAEQLATPVRLPAVRRRRSLFDAAQLLVALLASAMIAAVVSVAIQHRLVDESSREILLREVVRALGSAPRTAPAATVLAAPPPADVSAKPATPAVSVPETASAPTPAPAPPVVAPSAPMQIASLPLPIEIEKWHSLRRGMGRSAVRALLGYPKWVDHSRNIDFWLYEEDSIFGKGWIAFYDMDGPVSTWREP